MFALLRISSSSISLAIWFTVSLFLSFYQGIVQRSLVPFCFQHIRIQASPPFGVFCFLYDDPIARTTPRTFNVQPFPAFQVLRPRLTSVKQALHRCSLLLLRDTLCPPSAI